VTTGVPSFLPASKTTVESFNFPQCVADPGATHKGTLTLTASLSSLVFLRPELTSHLLGQAIFPFGSHNLVPFVITKFTGKKIEDDFNGSQLLKFSKCTFLAISLKPYDVTCLPVPKSQKFCFQISEICQTIKTSDLSLGFYPFAKKAKITFYSSQTKNISHTHTHKNLSSQICQISYNSPPFRLMGCPNFILNFHFQNLSAVASGHT
jgi:hypothetical protein